MALGVALAPWPVPEVSTPATTTTIGASPDASASSSSVTNAASITTTAAEVPDQPDMAYLQALLKTHCSGCHSAHPTLMGVAPKGTVFDTPAQIESHAAMIRQQVVVLKIMPPGNMTGMRDEERAAIERWYTTRQPQ
jgi:uncharacterized membrane protein